MTQNSIIQDRTILIICRRLSEVSLLSRLKPDPQTRYVVASDDLRVQESVKQYPWVDDVCWIEQMESLYEVASDVLTILEAVNRWLKSLANDRVGMPADFLFWIRHAEGGRTTQRIQDVLLLIRSYLHLLDTYNADRVVLLRDSNPRWEDDVLIQTARSRGIRIQKIRSYNRIKVLKFRTKVLMWRTRHYFKRALRATYHVYRVFNKIIQAKFRRQSKPVAPAGSQDEIVFQLCSSADKHVENIVPLMKALQGKGYKPVALTWGATQGAEKVCQEGLHAEQLEAFIPDLSSWETPYRVLNTRIKANRRMEEFFSLPELECQSVPLGPLLWPSVKHFLRSELAGRYEFSQAIKGYLKHHDPVAIKLWGGGVAAEGFLAWKNLNGLKRPLTFFYTLGAQIDLPYAPKRDPIDLFLAVGSVQKEYLERCSFPSEQIAMVGQGRYDHLTDWVKTHGPEMSRSYLNIPSSYDIYIFYDPNYVLRGYLTAQEQALVTNTLLSFAKEHPSAALIIKPHPAHGPGMLEQMIEHYSLPNVFLVDKSMLPYHALNAADVVITKFSTIGLEAMLFRRPVISVILDNEDRWQFVFQDAAEYVKTVRALGELLKRLINNTEFRSQWTEIQLKRQKHFLERYFTQRPQPAALLAADAIVSRLKVHCSC